MLLAATFALAVGGNALAAAVTIEPGVIQARFDASFSPRKLSRNEQTAAVVRAEMKFSTSDGSRLPALEEFEIGIDRHARLNLNGKPACRVGGRDASSLPVKCRESLVGTGAMDVFFHFPEGESIPTKNEVAIYKMSAHAGASALAAVTELLIPVPRQVAIPIAVESGHGRYGLKLVGSVPKLAGGSGSITHLGLRFHKGVFSAVCQDDHLDVRLGTTFVNGTYLVGSVNRPCTEEISG